MNGKESGRQMSTQPLSRIDFLQLSISTRQESIDRVAKHVDKRHEASRFTIGVSKPTWSVPFCCQRFRAEKATTASILWSE